MARGYTYSGRVPTQRLNRGALLRNLMLCALVLAAGWWIVTGRAGDWAATITGWLGDLRG